MSCLFLGAAVHKIRKSQDFYDLLDAYRLLPENRVRPATWLLIVAEAVTGLGVLVAPVRSPSLGLAITLLVAYSLAIGLNLWRGNTDIDCGCPGLGVYRRLSGWLLLRNGLLVAACALSLLPANDRDLGWLDWGAVILTVVAGASAYLYLDYRLATEFEQD